MFEIRDFLLNDAADVNRVALAAFSEFQNAYEDWETLSRNLANTAALAEAGEMVVAAINGSVVGAVVYVGPGKPKREFFPVEWPVVRMLVVAPEHRGHGIGRALMEECIRRAERDHAPLIGLHTSPIMKVALPLYLRMGFVHEREAPSVFGVSYAIYVKRLRPPAEDR